MDLTHQSNPMHKTNQPTNQPVNWHFPINLQNWTNQFNPSNANEQNNLNDGTKTRFHKRTLQDNTKRHQQWTTAYDGATRQPTDLVFLVVRLGCIQSLSIAILLTNMSSKMKMNVFKLDYFKIGDLGWSGMVLDGLSWSWMVSDDLIVLDGLRWSWIVLDSLRWSRMI